MTGRPAAIRQDVRVVDGFGYGVIGADLHVFQDRGPVYLLKAYEAARQADPGWPAEQPSRMLDARYRVVGFTGRRAEHAALAAWRDEHDRRLSVRWLHAPGGQGKTRLADEFAERSRAQGWKTVRALAGPGRRISPSAGEDLRAPSARGVLLVVDYADRWPVSHLAWLFSNALLHRPLPTRVLAIARSAQPWPVVRAVLTDVEAHTCAQALGPLSDEAGERAAMFAAARDGFAARYGLADPAAVEPPVPLTGPQFGLALSVHMAALVAVDARARGLRAPGDMAGVSSYLLDRERRHWANLSGAGEKEGHDYGTRPEAMAHTVFTAALTGAMGYEQGTRLLRGLDMRCDPFRLLADHALCYPPADPDTVLEPLLPDRLAEDLLALSFPGHRATDDYAPFAWAAATARALSARAPGAQPPAHAARLLTFLASAAAPGRWPHLAPHLAALLRADPGLAVAAGSAALTALADVDGLDPDVLDAVEAHFPRGRQTDLAPGIAAVTARVTARRLAATTDPDTRVGLFMECATRQNQAGRYEEALAAHDEAVAILEDRYAADPAYERPLALALGDRAVARMEVRRWQEAAVDAQRAVDLQRRLAAARPARFHPELAVALSHLGVSYAHLGRQREALDAEQEAVQFLSLQAEDDPAAHESDLAASLSNLGSRLAGHGRWEEALDAAERAVGIRRRLARTDPAGETPGLARSLSNLGTRHRDLGHWQEGLAAEEEAVALFERLAEANPAAYEAPFARSLANLGTHLSHCGRPGEALARTEQALAVRRRLAAAAPGAHGLELAESLAGYALALAEAGRHDEALAPAEDAVARLRRLHAADPGTHAERLARALASLARVGVDGGHDARAALSASGEALEIFYVLGLSAPAAHARLFAAVLTVHADILQALGRAAEADAVRRWAHTGDPSEVRRMMFPGL